MAAVIRQSLTFLALCILQAEAGFMSLCHFSAIRVQQVIMGEDIHAVVVAVHKLIQTID